MRRISRALIVALVLALLAVARHTAQPPAPEAAPPPAAPRAPRIALVGDILLAGRVGRVIAEHGAAPLVSGVTDVVREADLAIGNLECPLATTGEPMPEKTFTFRGDPGAVEALCEVGFDLVTLANNHSMDYGPEALAETLTTLRDKGVLAVGAGEDAAAARRPVIVERGSPPVRIAVLGFSNMLPAGQYATRELPGTSPAFADNIAADVAAARSEADVVIALFHWGDELSSVPSEGQRRLARIAADAGADVVAGHHPHVLQGLEARGSTLIAYSLGNFLFPSRGDAARTMILRYTPADEGVARADVIPCVIEGGRPVLASGEDRAAILAQVRALSAALGTELTEGGVIALPSRSEGGRSRGEVRGGE